MQLKLKEKPLIRHNFSKWWVRHHFSKWCDRNDCECKSAVTNWANADWQELRRAIFSLRVLSIHYSKPANTGPKHSHWIILHLVRLNKRHMGWDGFLAKGTNTSHIWTNDVDSTVSDWICDDTSTWFELCEKQQCHTDKSFHIHICRVLVMCYMLVFMWWWDCLRVWPSLFVFLFELHWGGGGGWASSLYSLFKRVANIMWILSQSVCVRGCCDEDIFC